MPGIQHNTCKMSTITDVRISKTVMGNISYGSKRIFCPRQTLVSYHRQDEDTYNQFHNIFRLFDILPNFPSTTSETMGDYYL